MTTRETKPERLARLALLYDQARAEEKVHKKAKDDLAAEIAGLMSEDERIDDLNYEGFDVQIAMVRKTSKVLDETRFRQSLPVKIWNKISRRTLDQDLLTVAVKEAVVTDAQLEAFTTEVPSKPYPVITVGPQKAKQ